MKLKRTYPSVRSRRHGPMLAKSVTIAILTVAGLLAGCADREGEFFESVVHEHSAVNFGAYSASAVLTRAGGTFIDADAFDAGDIIGVMGFHHDNSNWVADSATIKPNFMYDQEVTKQEDGTWTYSPKKYWPNETGKDAKSEGIDRLSFYGYYPYSQTGDGKYYNLIIPKNTDTGMGRWEFTVRDKSSEQVDFMLSDLAADQVKTKIDQKVELKFHHVLSQVTTHIQLADSLKELGCSLTVNQLALTNTLNHGYCTPTYDGSKTSFNWGDLSGQTTYSTDKEPDSLNRKLLLIPQEISAAVQASCTYTINFPADSLNPDGYSYEGNTFSVNLKGLVSDAGKAINKWEAGKCYTYIFTVGLQEILFDVTVANWQEREYGLIMDE